MSTSSLSSEFKLAPAPPPHSNRLKRAAPVLAPHLHDLEDIDLGEPTGPIYTGRFPYQLERVEPSTPPPQTTVPAREAFVRLFLCRSLVHALIVALLLLVFCLGLAYAFAVGLTALGRYALGYLESNPFITHPTPPAHFPTITFLTAAPGGCFVVVPPAWALAILLGWVRRRKPSHEAWNEASKIPGAWAVLLGATYAAGGFVGALGMLLVYPDGADPTPGGIGVYEALNAGLMGWAMVTMSLGPAILICTFVWAGCRR